MLKMTKEIFYKVGFYFLIIFLFGCFVGIYGAQKFIIERKLSEAIKLQGVVLNNLVYDIKLRP